MYSPVLKVFITHISPSAQKSTILSHCSFSPSASNAPVASLFTLTTPSIRVTHGHHTPPHTTQLHLPLGLTPYRISHLHSYHHKVPTQPPHSFFLPSTTTRASLDHCVQWQTVRTPSVSLADPPPGAPQGSGGEGGPGRDHHHQHSGGDAAPPTARPAGGDGHRTPLGGVPGGGGAPADGEGGVRAPRPRPGCSASPVRAGRLPRGDERRGRWKHGEGGAFRGGLRVAFHLYHQLQFIPSKKTPFLS